jgi:hypothetical protein
MPAAAVATATAAAAVVSEEDTTEISNTDDADIETTVAATEVVLAVEGPSRDVDTELNVESTHSRTPSAAVTTQSANQGGAVQKEALGVTSAQSAAAVTIQSAQRGRAARIQAATMRAERSAAASHIQSALSRRAGRKRAAATKEPLAPDAAKAIVGNSNSAPASPLEAVSTRTRDGWMATSPETSGQSSSPSNHVLGWIQSTTSASRNEDRDRLASAGEGETDEEAESALKGMNEVEDEAKGEAVRMENLTLETAAAATTDVGKVTIAEVEMPAAAVAAAAAAVVSEEDTTEIGKMDDIDNSNIALVSPLKTASARTRRGRMATSLLGTSGQSLLSRNALSWIQSTTSASRNGDRDGLASAGEGEIEGNTESDRKGANEVEDEGEANSTENPAVETALAAAAEVGKVTGADVQTPAAAVTAGKAAVVSEEDKTELGNTNDADMETTVAATEVAVAVEGPSSDVDTVTHVEATATHSRTPSTSVTIQSANQGGAGQKEALGMTSAQSAAAVTIQSAQRGRAARIQAATMHAERSAAASHIQSALSRRAGRKRAAAIQADAPNSSPYTLHPIP